jgi:hypothetical protein
MATVKSRIRRLEQHHHHRLLEWFIRQSENRSAEELDFFVRHGYIETSNINQRVVKPEEVQALDEQLKAIRVAMRGRSKADCEHSVVHGSWPECGQSVAGSCKQKGSCGAASDGQTLQKLFSCYFLCVDVAAGHRMQRHADVVVLYAIRVAPLALLQLPFKLAV